MLTKERLNEVLDYDPETGNFIRKITVNGRSAGKTSGRQVGRIAGSRDGHGYTVIGIDGKKYWAARLAFLWMTGEWPSYDVDHIDGNPSNNRWINLRQATTQQNLRHKRIQKNNKSGFKGVHKHKDADGVWAGKWRAKIKAGRHIHLGLFDCPVAAYLAYIVASDVHFGEFAKG